MEEIYIGLLVCMGRATKIMVAKSGEEGWTGHGCMLGS